jgi:hypothetical protein
MVIRGLPLKPYPERYFAKTSHGYYESYQKFDNETKTHRAATLAIFARKIPYFCVTKSFQ